MSEQEVDDVRQVLRTLSEFLPGKVMAYGAAHNRQPGMWHSILADYRQPDGSYLLPHALIQHIPRITRVFDRMCRIVASPEADPMGEDPWLDAAGDCIAGAAMAVGRRPFDARGPLAKAMQADGVDLSGVKPGETFTIVVDDDRAGGHLDERVELPEDTDA